MPVYTCMLWSILSMNYILVLLCYKLIIIHFDKQKQKKIKPQHIYRIELDSGVTSSATQPFLVSSRNAPPPT